MMFVWKTALPTTNSEQILKSKTGNRRVRLFVNDILNEIVFRCYYNALVTIRLTLDLTITKKKYCHERKLK